MEVVTETLKSGDSINFTGFGKFSPAPRAARQGVNPRTGERVQIKATIVPKFSAGSPAEGGAQARRLTERHHVFQRAAASGPISLPPINLKPMAVATLTFGFRVAVEVERKRSQLIVGLDPLPDLLPVELGGDVARFCCGIVDAVAPHAVAVKPQLAHFEALGADGMAAFAETCVYARRAGLLVIADGKRGDIGSTARAYSAAYCRGSTPLADALTVNPYLGRESIGPLSRRSAAAGRGHLLHRRDLERGRRRSGRRALRRPSSLAARRDARRKLGAPGLDRRARPLGGRRGRRRNTRARRRRSPQADAAGDSALPGVGAQGASPATSPVPSRAGPQARSSTRRARSTTPSVSRATTTRRRPVLKQRAFATRSGRCQGGSRPAGPWRRCARSRPSSWSRSHWGWSGFARRSTIRRRRRPEACTSLTSRSPRGITACGRATRSPPLPQRAVCRSPGSST